MERETERGGKEMQRWSDATRWRERWRYGERGAEMC